jgi:hypothetical protein
MTELADLPRIAAELHILDARPFGYAIDLHPLAPDAGAFVIATRPSISGGGFRPSRLLLPHQLYTKDLPHGSETWVLPVLSSWYCVAGPTAGRWHPPRTVSPGQ